MPDLLSNRLTRSAEEQFQYDWTRQRRTAADILRRLQHQEGVILADQVGMGKTYVALAVAVSQILAEEELGQVVVLVPPSVGAKWIGEWRKFSETLLQPETGIRCVPEAIRSGEDLLKALDDPPDRRNHIIVVTHTALTSNLKDPFIKLALVHYVTRRVHGGPELRRRFAKWSTGSSGIIPDRRFTPERVDALLSAPPARWRDVWRSATGEWLDDDPVPRTVEGAIVALNTSADREVLERLPVRRTADIAQRLKRVRQELSETTRDLWSWMLARTELDLPLLIVDEAHRLKNDSTQISRLFAQRSEDENTGALFGLFRRMLFLTATPFELGHRELTSVLSRMAAVRDIASSPSSSLEDRITVLGRSLEEAQKSAIRFSEAWGRLDSDDLPTFDAWGAKERVPPGASAAVREAWEHAQLTARARRDMNARLRPWVIRHERDHRRDYRPGRAILDPSDGRFGGLQVEPDSALPFLLAARAQSVASDEGIHARPLFAYGIASSYEAFLRLSAGSTADGVDSDVEERDAIGSDRVARSLGPADDAVLWYRREIDRALRDRAIRAAHPKLRATVQKATRLWLTGEKCLIFCWYIRTGTAVEQALVRRLDELIIERARARLGTGGIAETRETLHRISERLFRSDTTSYDDVRTRLGRALAEAVGRADSEYVAIVDLVVDSAIRHMRTPGYLVRYTALTADLTVDGVWEGMNGGNPSRRDLLARWTGFARRLAAARDQSEAVGGADHQDSEFHRVRDALLGAQQDDEAGASRGASLRLVRRASGQTRREDRERLIALFNTPFAPDLLVASSVMGEGIDLHQECRHVIHHDLDWNPSVLEQRTGRLDRIGALAERENRHIEVYEPYLAGTHDEKMYRVVKDRGAWFDVVMGSASSRDEAETDAEEGRVALHPRIRAALAMDLRSR